MSTVDPQELVRTIDVDPDLLARQANSLLASIRWIDPLKEWLPLVRNVKPPKLESLTGAARFATDVRLAAEVLLVCHEETTSKQRRRKPPTQRRFWTPTDDRLRANPGELDQVLFRFGLSPYPKLLLAVEGESDFVHVSRVLSLLDLAVGLKRIEVVRLDGIGNDVGILARYAGAPRFGKIRRRTVSLRRPLTHIAVLVDPEHDYRTKAGCRKKRDQIISELLKSVPPELRTPRMREDLKLLVSVNTWGRTPFEFAHFADTELARAVLKVAKGPVRCSREELRKSFAAQRKSPTPSVMGAWKNKVSRVSKVDIASQLWPTLERKVLDALKGTRRAPPIVRNLRKALAAARKVQGLTGLVFKG